MFDRPLDHNSKSVSTRRKIVNQRPMGGFLDGINPRQTSANGGIGMEYQKNYLSVSPLAFGIIPSCECLVIRHKAEAFLRIGGNRILRCHHID